MLVSSSAGSGVLYSNVVLMAEFNAGFFFCWFRSVIQ